MDYQVYVVLAPVAAIIAIAGAVRTGLRYSGALPSVVLAYFVSTAGLLVVNVAQLVTPSETLTVRFAQVQYLFLYAVVITWLWFALLYAARRPVVVRRTVVPLVVLGVINLVVVFTAHTHPLFWRSIEFFDGGGFLTFRGEFGPWFWVNGAFVYLPLLAGALIAIAAALDRPAWYRHQSVLVVIGIVVPTIFNIIYIFELVPGWQKDFTPLAYAFSGLAFLAGSRTGSLYRTPPLPRSVLLRDIPSGVVVIDPSGVISDINPAAVRLLGLRDPPVGTPANAIDRLDRIIKQIDVEEPSEAHLQVGSESVSVTTTPYVRHRRTVATVLTITDTTEWESLQERRRQLEVTLIEQERLATLGQLVANVAHEVNNPLTSLQSLFHQAIGVARGTRSGENLAEIEDGFARGMTRISTVLHRILDVARPPDSPATVPEIFDLHETIDATLQLVRPQYRSVAEIVRDYRARPDISGDPGAISQVILNIVLNAVQAIESSPGTIPVDNAASGRRDRITVATTDTDTGVECRITNTGPPIPEEVATRIFEPFFTTKHRRSGTGLGLAISRSIIEDQHHGTIAVLSTGTETGFLIRLPRGRSAGQSPEA